MYQTKQVKIITDFLEKNSDKQFSANEIFEKNSANVGKSSVYRIVDKLVYEGVIKRFNGENTKSIVYQYLGRHNECDNHFHLKCTECGALVHLECDYVSKLYKHIYKHHKFNVSNKKTIFYGLCEKCKDKEL